MMSELIAYRTSNGRRALLATVSLLALSSVATAAEENERPTVWIELGAQLEARERAQRDDVVVALRCARLRRERFEHAALDAPAVRGDRFLAQPAKAARRLAVEEQLEALLALVGREGVGRLGLGENRDSESCRGGEGRQTRHTFPLGYSWAVSEAGFISIE